MEIRDLETSFKDTLLHYSNRHHSTPKSKQEYVDVLWGKVFAYHDSHAHLNFDMVCRSLEGIPMWLQGVTKDFSIVVLAALIKHIGPSNNNGYTKYVVEKMLDWPKDKVDLLIELCQLRLHMDIPSYAPQSIMYDVNMMRLSFPRQIFLSNMKSVFAQYPTEKHHDVLRQQLTLMRFLLKRKTIFANEQVKRDNRELRALENIEFYVKMYDVPNIPKVEDFPNLCLT